MSTSPIIVYGFPSSPFVKKLKLVLLLKQIPYAWVETPMMPPRLALQMLGITYRRVPVLAIGNDLYFDTYLATAALEKLYPERPVITPETIAIQKLLAFYWTDRVVFRLIGPLFAWDKVPEVFLKDRGEFRGTGTINPAEMLRDRTTNLSELRTHMDLIEAQLSARTLLTNFVLDTSTPTFLDISIYFVLSWAQILGPSAYLFESSKSTHSLVVSYVNLFASYLETLPNLDITNLDEKVAANLILRSTPTPLANFITDLNEPLLLDRLTLGDEVEVTPTDTGKVPQKGVLIAINAAYVVLEVKAQKEEGSCRVLAPRLGFSVKKTMEETSSI